MTEAARKCLRATAARLIVAWLPAIFCGWLWSRGDHLLAGGLFAAVFIMVLHASLSPTSRLFGPVTTRISEPTPPGVWLTLDDGPDPATTPALLDILDRHQARAIFFLIGRKARENPDLVRMIVGRGHAIGNHSETHPAGRFWLLGPRQMWREIAGCQKTLAGITDAPVTWFRAPVGHHNFFTHPAANALGIRVMSWSCRGYDAVDPDAARVLRRIAESLSPGGIVLLHEATAVSAEILEGTLALIRERGLRVIPPPGARP